MPASKVYAFADPENDGERRVIRHLAEHLPAGYRIYHTMERQAGSQTYEWDVLVLAPHALFCLEVKDWPGQIIGNDREWLLANGAVRRNPCPLIAKKARILKSLLVERDAFLKSVWVEPLVVIADEQATLALSGDCAKATATLKDVVGRLTDAAHPRWAGRDHRASFDQIERVLTADFRPASQERVIGHFRLVEQIGATDLYTEWRAENRFAPSAFPVRLKIYAPDPYLPAAEREQQLQLVRRDFEAAARMGNHPNIVGARDFFPSDGGRYVLMLEDLPGTPLSAELLSGRALTFERKLAIVEDIAAGLAHAHACKVVHRDLRPSNIWLTPTGAVLVNFDCARIGNGRTVHDLVEGYLDPHYLAPEVRQSAAYASAASDIYALGAVLYELLTGNPPNIDADSAVSIPAPSAADPLVDPKLDELTFRMLAREAAQRPSADEVRDILAELRDRRHAGTPQASAAAPAADGALIELPVGSKIDGQYLVREKLGEGSFGKVYRVYSAITDREYAMKVFSEPDLGLEDVQKEFRILAALSHPRIVRVWHAGLLRQEVRAYYLLTDYIPGRSLQQLLETDPPTPMQALHIARDILQALEYLHSQSYVHRDIKPSNLVVSLAGTWLIDFNIAAHAGRERHDRSGTPLYTPPDVDACGLQPSRDLFAVGVVLFQMLTGKHPYEGIPSLAKTPRDPAQFQPRLNEPMARILRRAVAPRAASRYATAAEFLADLAAIEEPLLPPPPQLSLATDITIAPEERAEPNYNPYLTRFLTLYSQNRIDNSGTRGYDEVSCATYVRTRLDKRLAPDIVAGKYRLVIITGNAGDGKTAFLQRLEKCLAAGFDGQPRVAVTPLLSGNGATFELGGRCYRTNYDGSQNEGSLQNDEALADFFAPFAGTAAEIASRSDDQGRLIAINEGKLRDFFARHRARFAWLSGAVEAYLDSGTPLPDGYLVVNLNDRSVVARGPEVASIVDQQIRALCDPVFWEPCQPCKYADRCPVKFNVDTINHADLGPRVRQRLELLFEIAHLRGRMHLTMRSVRSALAYLLFGERNCREIAQELEGGSELAPDRDEQLLRRFYYNAIALDTVDGLSTDKSREETDRLLLLLSEADMGIGSNAPDDRELHFNGVASSLLPRVGGRSDYDKELLQAWSERLNTASPDDPDTRASRRRLHAALRRKAFFERPDDRWLVMLPYSMLEDTRRAIEGDTAALARLKGIILRGINCNEGLGEVEDALVLRVARGVTGSVRSYRRFPAADFELRPVCSPTVNEYVETSPASLELVYRPGGDGPGRKRPTLRLSLDLIELLGRMAEGYAPTTAEYRGLLVNLLVFRTLLAHETYDQLILLDTAQERRFRVEQHGGQVILRQEDGGPDVGDAKSTGQPSAQEKRSNAAR